MKRQFSKFYWSPNHCSPPAAIPVINNQKTGTIKTIQYFCFNSHALKFIYLFIHSFVHLFIFYFLFVTRRRWETTSVWRSKANLVGLVFSFQVSQFRFQSSTFTCLLARPPRGPSLCILKMNSMKWKEPHPWLALQNAQSVMALCSTNPGQWRCQVGWSWLLQDQHLPCSDAATAEPRVGVENQRSTADHTLPQAWALDCNPQHPGIEVSYPHLS